MTEALHTLYRPQTFDQVVGQTAVITSLKNVIKRRGAQAYLFCGPAGTGKTTLARIVASELGCAQNSIMEIDAATFTGIDAMRQVQETVQYKPFGKSEHRAVLIDEIHRLSRNAFDSLLKIVEEPPAHVTWLFATTEVNKVPKTIQTRCAAFTLKPVNDKDLLGLIEEVSVSEKIKLSDGMADIIVRESGGSPRQALVNLALCRDLKTRQEAAQVLRSALSSDPVHELCQYVCNGGSWQKAMAIIAKLEDENPEGVRLVIVNYVGKALQSAKSDDAACRFLSILEAFSAPYNNSENLSPLLLSLGRVLFAQS
jgi:DNA polymerase-3 subunit gamma/tau